MRQQALFKASYPQDFEAFWEAYGVVKNASKPDGLRAFMQVKLHLPELPILLECVRLYRSWLALERKKQPTYPQLHAATFLRQRRWESWLEQIEARSAHRAASSKPLNFPDNQKHLWEKLEAEIGTDSLQCWFSEARYEGGKIIVPKAFHRDRILYKYNRHLTRIFGPDTGVEVG